MLFKAIQLLKNWYMLPLVYFKIITIPIVEFEIKNGLKLKMRNTSNSNDIQTFTEVWLENQYLPSDFKVKSNDNVIDIGAHVGMFSAFISQYCKNGKIISYEPDKENYKMLTDLIQLNNLENITAFNRAVSSKSGKIKFYLDRKDSSAHSMYKENRDLEFIKSDTIEDIFKNSGISECNLLKMDCEGAEFDILMNLSHDYLKRIDKISLEYHEIDEIPYKKKDLIKKLKDHNFSIKIKPLTKNTGLLYAKRKSFD